LTDKIIMNNQINSINNLDETSDKTSDETSDKTSDETSDKTSDKTSYDIINKEIMVQL
jgi:hypothetical protein